LTRFSSASVLLSFADNFLNHYRNPSQLRPQASRRSRKSKLRPINELLEDRQMFDASTVRSIDGTSNNLLHPDWGSTNEQLLRISPAEYADGISAPAGTDRPSARTISNAFAAHVEEDTPNERNMSAYVYIWGQFLDHDLDLTESANPRESFNVAVPMSDPYFDPNGTGTQLIPLSRSAFDASTGTSKSNPRQQINQVTAWIDGSMIYGSDATRAAALRTFVGGKLKVSSSAVGDFPPLNTAGLPNANDAHRVTSDKLFLAGDVRANENIELTSLHTIFLREHNRLAEQIARADRRLTDEQIYQKARAQVIAEIQAITYKQWLPALLGSDALRQYRGYNASVNPGIANEFSTAAFRLHTTINDDVEFFDNSGRPITFTYTDDNGVPTTVDGEVALFDAFFNPTMFTQTGVDGILKYAASTHAEELDGQLVDSLRNFLFGQPGQGGLDLASLNIQRGRDHGLADYNQVRVSYGLPAVKSFAEISSDPEVQQKLQSLYGDVNNIDLWVGVLAEDHVRGSSAGPLAQKILTDQFQRLRDGDRFWYQRVFSGQQLDQIERTTLADIIERNSNVVGLQDNVFVFRAEVSGQVFVDRNASGALDRLEVGLAGVKVELINDEGDVIATTISGRDGRYRFTSFHETGDYTVRVTPPAGMVLTTPLEQEFLVSSGDANLRNRNFGLRASLRSTDPTRPRTRMSANDSALLATLDDHSL
jgi:peroxidase